MTATATLPTEPTGVLVLDGRAVHEKETRYYKGLMPLDITPVKAGVMQWKGAKISKELWHDILAFLQYSYDIYKAEAQVRLYYSTKFDRWAAIALPQEINGRAALFTKELSDHPDRNKLLEAFDLPEDEWHSQGTVHHHCAISAFQSGTDSNDEKDKNGLHITIGHMNRDVYDIHARMTYLKSFYEVDLAQWLDYTEPGEIVAAVNGDDCPDAWAESLIEPPPLPVYTPPAFGYGYSYPQQQGQAAPYQYNSNHWDTGNHDRKRLPFRGYNEFSDSEVDQDGRVSKLECIVDAMELDDYWDITQPEEYQLMMNMVRIAHDTARNIYQAVKNITEFYGDNSQASSDDAQAAFMCMLDAYLGLSQIGQDMSSQERNWMFIDMAKLRDVRRALYNMEELSYDKLDDGYDDYNFENGQDYVPTPREGA